MSEPDLLQKLQESKLATGDISPQIFDKIATHVEKEEMDAAMQMIHEAFEEGNFDMRLISYYFYADFLKSGVKSFKEILPAFVALTTDHWEALRPSQRKEKQIESSFNWFFTHVINKLKYNDRLRKEDKPLVWSSEQLQMTEEEFLQLQDVVIRFNDFFHQKWAKSSSKERVSHLLKKIVDLKPLMVAEPEVEQEVVLEEETKVKEKAEPTAPAHLLDTTLFETPELINLIKKLKTFEQLAEKQQFLKAAVVSNDISQILAQFDPCFYFPKLFSTYFNLLARNSAAIAETSENQESIEWKALERLYKTDLDQFTQW